MQTRYIYLLRFILPVVDLLMLNAVYYLAFYLTSRLGIKTHTEWHNHYLVICNLLWLVNSLVVGLYTEASAKQIEKIYRATWKTVVLHGAMFTCYLFFFKDSDFSRSLLIVFYSLLIFACILNRFIGTVFQYILVKKFKATKNVAIMGSNYTAARLKQYLKSQRNLHFYGFVGSNTSMFPDKHGNLRDDMIFEITEAVNAGVKDLYVCVAPERMDELGALIKEADKQLIRLKFIPDMGRALASSFTITYLGGEFPMMTLRNEPLEHLESRFKKRAFDMCFSFLVILFILSWLFPIIAIIIRLESKGPILFRQLRSGRNDKPFWCYKFRSMTVNGDSHLKQATKDDARVTRVGRFLRRTSLDELPQFFNVFEGNMSVVGPRPHMLKHTEEYRALIDKFMVRHFAKPGITGWAQVNGLRGETKETEDMEQRVEHDIYYVENWSLMWDIRIIFLTIINVFRGDDNAF